MTSSTSVLTFFPDTTSCPRAYRLLRAAAQPAQRPLADPSDASDISPFGEILEYAITAKMSCLLADWLTRNGHTQPMPRPMQQFLRNLVRLNTYRSRVHHREAVRIIAELRAAGIPAAAINGIAHAALLYPRGLRQSSDVDVLLPADRAADAAAVLATSGYYSTGRRSTALHRDFGDPLVPGLTLDLTSRLAHTDDPQTIDVILSRVVEVAPADEDDGPLTVLDRRDGFVHTLARTAKQRRWPALADAMHYAVDGLGGYGPESALPEPALAGWHLVLQCRSHAGPPVTTPEQT
jgi:hypothetical protein